MRKYLNDSHISSLTLSMHTARDYTISHEPQSERFPLELDRDEDQSALISPPQSAKKENSQKNQDLSQLNTQELISNLEDRIVSSSLVKDTGQISPIHDSCSSPLESHSIDLNLSQSNVMKPNTELQVDEMIEDSPPLLPSCSSQVNTTRILPKNSHLNCHCLIPKDFSLVAKEFILIQCETCSKWAHSCCFGYLYSVPNEHTCYPCQKKIRGKKKMPDPETQCQLAYLRIGVAIAWLHGITSRSWLSKTLRIFFFYFYFLLIV